MNNTEINDIISKINCNSTVGNRYYKSENDILKRKKTMYYKSDEGHEGIMNDPYKANNTLSSGYFKILVEQKINFSLGKPFTLEIEEIDRPLKNTIKTISREASKNSVGWGYIYIQDGILRIKSIPTEQILPIYEDEEYGILSKAYRSYMLNGEYIFEIITKDSVQTYIKENNEYILKAEKPHFITGMRYGNDITNVQGKGWQQVPIIPLYNNEERTSDLHNIKGYIDIFDIVQSDFANNLEDIQDAYWVIKGYNGNNVSELLNNIKQYKAAKVGEGGDAHLETQDIPYEAKKVMLELTEQSIFLAGMGFDTNKVGEGNATNYIIQMRISNLKLKASAFETQIQEFMFRLISFVNEFYNKSYTDEEILIKFNREQLINESELLTSIAQQKGIVSDETLMEVHPWVEDKDEEEERMSTEKEVYPIKEDVI